MVETTRAISGAFPSLHWRVTAPGLLLGKYSVGLVGQTALLATSTNEHVLEVDGSEGWHLSLPTYGSIVTRAEGREVISTAGREALLVPNVKRRLASKTRSMVVANIDKERLVLVGAGMTGKDPRSLPLDEGIHRLDLEHRQGMFASFLNICRTLDGTRGDTSLAGLLGIEDMIYRWLALALGWLDEDTSPAPKQAPGRLDGLCDMIRQSFERSLTMTEMERISGLSSRALQYAFRDRFGCSPMEWQRRERMALAQQHLIAIGPKGSITDLAHAMGISSSAAFATLYKRHFGETPSQTRARVFGPEGCANLKLNFASRLRTH